MATSYHAEHVGSLLRPPELLKARTAREQGEMSDEEFKALEDRAALAAIEVQREAGIEVFTDGEVRRVNWMDGLLESLGGVTPMPPPTNIWFREDGSPPPEETTFKMVAANAKLTQKRLHTAAEAEFMARHSPGRFKITMISASMSGLMWAPGISDTVYPEPADLVRDAMKLQIAEIEHLIDMGVTWIQLDSLSYNQVIDPGFKERVGAGALEGREILDACAAVDTEIVAAVRRKNPDVTVGMHICRGNNRSAWMSEGSFEPIAEKVFGGVGVDRFLLEYDTERAGGFEPLRFVPDGTTVVLGLVSSKVPDLEAQDDLLRRIEQAAKYVPMENLAISPQCGFASTSQGNLLTVDEERRKLELVVETAQHAWT
jgi:5-methyltetrahydropteroyltriglutamate--homocysteine methyltransferase